MPVPSISMLAGMFVRVESRAKYKSRVLCEDGAEQGNVEIGETWLPRRTERANSFERFCLFANTGITVCIRISISIKLSQSLSIIIVINITSGTGISIRTSNRFDNNA